MKRRLSAILSMLLLVIVISPAAFAARSKPRATAPDFTLPVEKDDVSLRDLRGKVVLVDFWASWCLPCRESFPWMSSMLEKYGDKGLVIVAINLDKKRESANAFLEKYPAPFTVAFDPSGKTAEAFRVGAMPTSFIVNRTGEIVYEHAGFRPAEAQKVEQEIKEALSR
jgi:peroxiredoxin